MDAAAATDDDRGSVATSAHPPEKQPQLRRHAYSFWSPELKELRIGYFKIVLAVCITVIFVMWLCLPVYWASLAHAGNRPSQLRAWIIDRDGSTIGSAISSAVMQTTTNTHNPFRLGWRQISADEAGSDAEISSKIVDEHAWAAIVVEANATANLLLARQTGNSSYDPTSAITFIYEQARNELAANNFIVPIVTALLTNLTSHLGVQSSAQYLQSVLGNETALALIAQAPQTIASQIAWKNVNLRPYTASVAQAVTLVGQIYITIFAFVVTMANDAARATVSSHLTLKSYLRIRIMFPLLLYIPLSFSYAMISLPFHLPFGAKYPYAGGFFLFWIFVYLGMSALGLALEAVITLLTTRFVTYFLLPLIIINISVTSLPHELQPWFFLYGLGFPIFNLSQAVRTIIFNTKNHLALNAGVLLCWIALSLITLPLFTIFMRRREARGLEDPDGKTREGGLGEQDEETSTP